MFPANIWTKSSEFDSVPSIKKRIGCRGHTDVGGDTIHHDSHAVFELLHDLLCVWITEYIEGLLLNDELWKRLQVWKLNRPVPNNKAVGQKSLRHFPLAAASGHAMRSKDLQFRIAGPVSTSRGNNRNIMVASPCGQPAEMRNDLLGASNVQASARNKKIYLGIYIPEEHRSAISPFLPPAVADEMQISWVATEKIRVLRSDISLPLTGIGNTTRLGKE